MINRIKSVFDNIKTVEPNDDLYDYLPQMVPGEENTIYTVQRVAARQRKQEIDGQWVTIETSVPVIRVFLVFDINNQLYQDCITKGKCKIHKYDTLVVVRMDENYRGDATVESYMDLSDPIDKYIVHEESLGRGRFYGDVSEFMSLVSYYQLYTTGKTSGMIDRQITDMALLGGKQKVDVKTYDSRTRTNYLVTKEQEVEGLLSKINAKLIHR